MFIATTFIQLLSLEFLPWGPFLNKKKIEELSYIWIHTIYTLYIEN